MFLRKTAETGYSSEILCRGAAQLLYNLAMMAQRNSEPLRFAVCKFACLDAAGFKKLVLAAPQLFGEIHEVSLRILETLDLIPQSINLTDAVLADVLNIRAVVNALACLNSCTRSGRTV